MTYKDAIDFLERIRLRERDGEPFTPKQIMGLINPQFYEAQKIVLEQKDLVQTERLPIVDRKFVEKPRPTITQFKRLDIVNRNGKRVLVARDIKGRFFSLEKKRRK